MIDKGEYSNRCVSKCVCGADARIRYKIPVFWVECKKKCGMRTRFYSDNDDAYNVTAKDSAVKEWNRMVSKDG